MDFDRRTGALIGNYASAVQAVEVILTTRLGELVMLRQFGGGLTELLGRAMTPRLFGAFRLLIAAAIDLWEPRFRVRQVIVEGDADALRLGNAAFAIEVDWRPRGHLGDESVAAVKSFSLGVTGGGLVAEA